MSERKGKVIPCRWTENRKGAGTSSGESGVRNLETDSIKSRAESIGGSVKLKTVTEIRRSSAWDTYIAESVYLVLNFVVGLGAKLRIIHRPLQVAQALTKMGCHK